MNAELLVMALVVLLLVGCGARGGSKESKLDRAFPVPGTERPSADLPAPAYGLPLEMQIDLPEVPAEIQKPSAPIPEGTPMPGGLFSGWGGAKP